MYTGLSSYLTINGLDGVTGDDLDYSVTEYHYNEYTNLLEKVIDPMLYEETYEYDLNGNLCQKIDGNKYVTTYIYDGLNRIKSKTVVTPDTKKNASYSYTYTLTGNKYTVEGGSVDYIYNYDDCGRLIKEQESTGIIKSYDYDASNNRIAFVTKKGTDTQIQLSYKYDKMNRLWKVFEGPSVTATYLYDENGNRRSLEYANGNSTSYYYNAANKLTSLTNEDETNIVSQYKYTYYLDGNQASKNDIKGEILTEYVYDELGRLYTETVKQGDKTTSKVKYSYDDFNNRESMSLESSGVTTTTRYLYDKNDRLLLETKVSDNLDERNIYSYDRNGNMIFKKKTVVKPLGSEDETDFTGCVVGEEGDEGGTYFYGYDGFNQLISYAGEKKTATYAYNGHGDVVQLTDTSGKVVKTYDYDAFGNEKQPVEDDVNPFRYCGEYWDKETKTYYLRARFYNPAIGRFNSADSFNGNAAEPLSLNLYTYCYNNPLLYTDPSGHFAEYVFEQNDFQGENVFESISSFGATQTYFLPNNFGGGTRFYDLNFSRFASLKWGKTDTVFGIDYGFGYRNQLRLDYGTHGSIKNLPLVDGISDRWHWNIPKQLKNQTVLKDHQPVFGKYGEGLNEVRLVKTARYIKYGGRVLLVVGVVSDSYAIATSEDKVHAAIKKGAGWGGAFLGAKAGGAALATAGSCFGPYGTAIGGVVGGLGGYFAGEEIVDRFSSKNGYRHRELKRTSSNVEHSRFNRFGRRV